MPKKTSSKKARQVQENNNAVEEEKPSPVTKKSSSKKAKQMQENNNAVEQENPSPVTKKSSSKKAKQMQESNNAVEEKLSSVQKKAVSEIDEIFAGKKRKKSESEKTEKPNEEATGNPKKTKKKKKDKGSNDSKFAEPPSWPRKRTNDGFTVYTEEELGIDKSDAGCTPLCPFDCSCCFWGYMQKSVGCSCFLWSSESLRFSCSLVTFHLLFCCYNLRVLEHSFLLPCTLELDYITFYLIQSILSLWLSMTSLNPRYESL